MLALPELAGLRGETIDRFYNLNSQTQLNVSLLIKKSQLLEAVDHLRDCGAIDVAASQLSYLFDGHSEAYQTLFGNDH